MQCPKCGEQLAEHGTYCGSCGAPVSKDGKAGQDPSPVGPKQGQEPPSPVGPSEKEPRESRVHWIAIGLLAVFALAMVLIVAVPLAQEQINASRDEHRVTFIMKTPGYNNDATAIPVQVKGTLANGNAFDQLIYLDGGGNGVVLEPGDYTLSFPGGSILANGTVLAAPSDQQLEVSVPTGLTRNEFVQLPADQVVAYTAIAPLDLTEEVLDGVYALAVEAPNDYGKADELRTGAWKAHEDAVTQKAADTAAVEKKAKAPLTASTGDEATFIGTLQICSPEEAAERLGDESLAWNFYGQTLAILWLDEPRKVTMQDASTYGVGGYYDEYGNYVEETTAEFELTCLVLSADVEGLYSYEPADDGTLASLNGSHVLASGKLAATADWAASQLSPITLVNPTFELV